MEYEIDHNYIYEGTLCLFLIFNDIFLFNYNKDRHIIKKLNKLLIFYIIFP